jgi:hypothetical protein
MAFAFPKPNDKLVINNSLPLSSLTYNQMSNLFNQTPKISPIISPPVLPTLSNAPTYSQCRTTCLNMFNSNTEYLKCGSSSIINSTLNEEGEQIKCIGSQRQQLYDCNKACSNISNGKIMSGKEFIQKHL